jgi:uncharacterized membrane protein
MEKIGTNRVQNGVGLFFRGLKSWFFGLFKYLAFGLILVFLQQKTANSQGYFTKTIWISCINGSQYMTKHAQYMIYLG